MLFHIMYVSLTTDSLSSPNKCLPQNNAIFQPPIHYRPITHPKQQATKTQRMHQQITYYEHSKWHTPHP